VAEGIYQLRHLNYRREYIGSLDPIWFQWTRLANKAGKYTAGYSTRIPRALVEGTRFVEVWRAPGPGWSKRREETYLVRKPGEKQESDGRECYTLEGDGQLVLIDAPIVADYAGSAAADKSGPVTDVMRAYVREQSTRLREAYPITVQADTGQGPTVSEKAARGKVLATLQKLAKAAAESATPTAVFFDLEQTDAGFFFAVNIGQPHGARDRRASSASPAVLWAAIDFMEWEAARDASAEATVAYVGGGGSGDNRTILTVTDPTRLHDPPGNRWEIFVDGGDTTDSAVLTTAGEKALGETKRVDRLWGTLVGGLYGTDRLWFGDRLMVQRHGGLYTARLEGLSADVKDGHEQMVIRLEAVRYGDGG
jgi:hypothetical protein